MRPGVHFNNFGEVQNENLLTFALLAEVNTRKENKYECAFVVCLLQKGTKGLGCKVIKFRARKNTSTFRKVRKLTEKSRLKSREKNSTGITHSNLYTLKLALAVPLVLQVYTQF